MTRPQNKIKKFETGKAWLGSNSSTPRIIDEYTVPPPIPQEVANELLTIKTNNSINSKGYKGKKPLNTHFFAFSSQ